MRFRGRYMVLSTMYRSVLGGRGLEGSRAGTRVKRFAGRIKIS
jgi:hypothetical protein